MEKAAFGCSPAGSALLSSPRSPGLSLRIGLLLFFHVLSVFEVLTESQRKAVGTGDRCHHRRPSVGMHSVGRPLLSPWCPESPSSGTLLGSPPDLLHTGSAPQPLPCIPSSHLPCADWSPPGHYFMPQGPVQGKLFNKGQGNEWIPGPSSELPPLGPGCLQTTFLNFTQHWAFFVLISSI